MMKRVISLLLCVLMLVPVMASCAKKEEGEEDLGAHINMYLTDPVYDLDPAKAYNNESALRIVSLLYDNLFVLDDKGNVKKSLAKDYTINEDPNSGEYEMIITLKETCWTDGTMITANDVYYAWTRILQATESYEAASLLYDIKNARAAKEGDVSIDDVAISAINETQLRILFEEPIDYDQFLIKLTSYALVPLREDIVSKSADWSKKPATTCTSGPFKIREVKQHSDDVKPSVQLTDGTNKNKTNVANYVIDKLVLERNAYYYRDIQKDKIDKRVTPYRLVIDYTMTDEEIIAEYEAGKLFYIGDIPLSVRGSYSDIAEVTDALSTHTYIPNQNAFIKYYDATEFKNLSSLQDIYDWKQTTVVGYTPPKDEGEAGAPAAQAEDETNGAPIFAIPEVREAMSLALDREAIAEMVVFAKAASGLVPYGVFDADSSKDIFREVGGELISGKDMAAAKTMLNDALKKAGHEGKQFMFAISVNANDEVHMEIAKIVQKAWEELGFKVAIKAISTIKNLDMLTSIKEVPGDIGDDLFTEAYNQGLFEVAAIDYTAYSADAFSVLAPFAKGFTGRSSYVAGETDPDKMFDIPAHLCGYNSESFNAKIEEAFAEKDIKARAEILHEAEKILIDDMAVIPVIFNQTATLTHDDLSKVDFGYYGNTIFTKTKLKDYELYIPVETETEKK